MIKEADQDGDGEIDYSVCPSIMCPDCEGIRQHDSLQVKYY